MQRKSRATGAALGDIHCRFREKAMSENHNNKHDSAPDSGRRSFLKGATLAGAAALTAPSAANTVASPSSEQRPKAAVPGPKLAAADAMPPPADPGTQSSILLKKEAIAPVIADEPLSKNPLLSLQRSRG